MYNVLEPKKLRTIFGAPKLFGPPLYTGSNPPMPAWYHVHEKE